ncbi:PREDICTED: 21 kDa protein-like [Nicotiana attenuata]|uniref:21 kDa protein n=1 Tax=Nicotiana attenuata TaxID=49451 RepID=A0A1J6IVB6_NICAT|nr:PREDICTED: 21 kDa protein-like [Nicotiana attenuata]OIT08220.1 21 kda protein [Nicotiana attenuata]
MEKITLFLILLFLNVSIFSFVGAVKGTSASLSKPHANKLVLSQCRRTRYPKLCMTSLSNYVTSTSQPQELAQAALQVSLVKAIYAKAYVNKVCKQLEQTKAKDYQVVKSCLDQISDGVSLLSNSVQELHHLNLDKESDFMWHRSNVQTWLSTVLTDAFTCMDGISGYKILGGKVKATIKAKVLNVAQVTSNALALFNGYAVRHKVSHHSTSGKINKP